MTTDKKDKKKEASKPETDKKVDNKQFVSNIRKPRG